MKTGCRLLLALLVWNGVATPRAHGDDPADFEDFLSRYRQASPDARTALTGVFIERRRAAGGFPIVGRDGSVVFFHRGAPATGTVQVMGEFRTRGPSSISWDPHGLSMERAAAGGDVFFRRARFELDARIEYLFSVDGKPTLDPLNPHTADSGAAPTVAGRDPARVSALAMPAYQPLDSSLDAPAAHRGRLVTIDESWAHPKVTLYLPPGYDQRAPDRRYPVLYTADGSAWIEQLKLPAILDGLIASGAITEALAVMIDPAEDRASWYSNNPAFLAYLERVVAHVDSHFATRAEPAARVHAGTSAGGRASLFVALERPQLFGNIALLSPSLTAPPSTYEALLTGRQRLARNTRVWLSAGTYEEYIHRDARLFQRLFARAGVTLATAYTHEGHSFAAWRRLLPRMLAHVLPATRTGRARQP